MKINYHENTYNDCIIKEKNYIEISVTFHQTCMKLYTNILQLSFILK